MDTFGVLVQNYGIRGQGKSAPMAASKTATQTHDYNNPANLDQPFGSKEFSKSTHNSNSVIGSFLDENDIFGFSSEQKPQSYVSSDVFDDVFQMPTKNSSFSNGGSAGFDFDMESAFMGSVNLNAKSSDVNNDMIWGFSKKKVSSKVVESNDLLSSDPVDDFLGTLGNLGSNPGKRSVVKKGDTVDSDDLISGFESTSTTNDRAQASSTQKSAGFSYLDELEDFATSKIKKNANGNFDASRIRNELNKTSKHKSQETNFFDIEGSSHVHSVPKGEVERESDMIFQTEATDLDSFFSAHSRTNIPVSKDKSEGRKTEEVPDLFFGTTLDEKKIPPSSFPDDFSSIFGGSPSAGRFEEHEGESDVRRNARFGWHQRTAERMARALADMNQREFKAQQEQEERHRIAEAMDMEMKQWAAGKEGNLRALLSSLQQVLGPESGWRPVTLTDLITSSQVKIAYKKAALCVHPDKVQQKGASLQQKFVAEKVFDILKEAWNKFNSEELR